MQFLLKMEEKREKERIEIVERLEGVKSDVKGAVKAVTDRQDKMEVQHEVMRNDIGVLKTQMEEIRNIVEVKFTLHCI